MEADVKDLRKKGVKIAKIVKYRIKNEHSWISVYGHHSFSQFTSTERSTCLLIFIVSTLALNALFFGQNSSLASDFTIGVITGFGSAIPLFFITYFFKKSR
jgi:hypothetical protein